MSKFQCDSAALPIYKRWLNQWPARAYPRRSSYKSAETGDSVRSIFETLIKLIQDNSKNKDYIQIWGEPDGSVPPRSLTIEENENALITCLKDFLAEDITEERIEEYHPLLHQLYLRRKPLIKLMRQAGINVPTFLRPDDSISRSNRPPASVPIFPAPEATRWKDITISFLSDEYLEIKAPKLQQRYTFAECGLKNLVKKEHEPNRIGKFLMKLADNQGRTRGATLSQKDSDNLKGRVKDTRKVLWNITGIK